MVFRRRMFYKYQAKSEASVSGAYRMGSIRNSSSESSSEMFILRHSPDKNQTLFSSAAAASGITIGMLINPFNNHQCGAANHQQPFQDCFENTEANCLISLEAFSSFSSTVAAAALPIRSNEHIYSDPGFLTFYKKLKEDVNIYKDLKQDGEKLRLRELEFPLDPRFKIDHFQVDADEEDKSRKFTIFYRTDLGSSYGFYSFVCYKQDQDPQPHFDHIVIKFVLKPIIHPTPIVTPPVEITVDDDDDNNDSFRMTTLQLPVVTFPPYRFKAECYSLQAGIKNPDLSRNIRVPSIAVKVAPFQLVIRSSSTKKLLASFTIPEYLATIPEYWLRRSTYTAIPSEPVMKPITIIAPQAVTTISTMSVEIPRISIKTNSFSIERPATVVKVNPFELVIPSHPIEVEISSETKSVHKMKAASFPIVIPEVTVTLPPLTIKAASAAAEHTTTPGGLTRALSNLLITATPVAASKSTKATRSLKRALSNPTNTAAAAAAVAAAVAAASELKTPSQSP